MLMIRDLTKSVGGPQGRRLFDGLQLELRAGEYVAIMGESGTGKSTLLNLIAGLDRPDGGQIHLDGHAIEALDDAAATRLRRRCMGFVFQSFHVLPHLSVADNVELPLLLLGEPAGQACARVQAMLQAVGLGDRATSMPRELSGGELQRVAIARALVHEPVLLLADEPTGNLDAATADQILHLLRDCIRAVPGAMGILVTHSARAAASTDRVLRLGAQGLQDIPLPSGPD